MSYYCAHADAERRIHQPHTGRKIGGGRGAKLGRRAEQQAVDARARGLAGPGRNLAGATIGAERVYCDDCDSSSSGEDVGSIT